MLTNLQLVLYRSYLLRIYPHNLEPIPVQVVLGASAMYKRTTRHPSEWLGNVFKATLLFIAALLLSSCGTALQTPVYPDVTNTIDAKQAVILGNVTPHFGSELTTASGSYYLATGSVDTVERWYDQQVAEQTTLVYVNEHRDGERLHRLYRRGSQFGPIVEVVTQPADGGKTLVAIYSSIERNSSDANGSWLRRVWGFLLGYTGPSLADVAFGYIVKALQPVRVVY